MTWVLEMLWQTPHQWPPWKERSFHLHRYLGESLDPFGYIQLNWRSHASSIWRCLWGRHFRTQGLKRSFQSTSAFRWNPTKILQLWLSKFRLLQPLSRSSLDRIKKWSYDFSRRKIGLEPIKKMKEIASEAVTVEGQLPRTNPTQTIFGRWEKRWTSWGKIGRAHVWTPVTA